MNMRTLRITLLAITSVICGSAMSETRLSGVPGEAFVVPLKGGRETFVNIRVPSSVGQDFVINRYTAPHVMGDEVVVDQSQADFRIHWQIFINGTPHRSGVCELSPGDSVSWTTSTKYLYLQTEQDTKVLGDRPSSRCGTRDTFGSNWSVEVRFQTYKGSRGEEPDFAFEASAYAVDQQRVISIPANPVIMKSGR